MNPARYPDYVLRKFTIDHEHFFARWLASILKNPRRWKTTGEDAQEILDLLARSPRMRKLLDQALKGERLRSDLTPTGIMIVRAWFAAAERCGMFTYAGERQMTLDLNTPSPTLHEVKMEYARLFVKQKQPQNKTARAWLTDLAEHKKIPPDRSFRTTLNRCKCEFRLEKPRMV